MTTISRQLLLFVLVGLAVALLAPYLGWNLLTSSPQEGGDISKDPIFNEQIPSSSYNFHSDEAESLSEIDELLQN